MLRASPAAVPLCKQGLPASGRPRRHIRLTVPRGGRPLARDAPAMPRGCLSLSSPELQPSPLSGSGVSVITTLRYSSFKGHALL